MNRRSLLFMTKIVRKKVEERKTICFFPYSSYLLSWVLNLYLSYVYVLEQYVQYIGLTGIV